jgi:hypothetical protein
MTSTKMAWVLAGTMAIGWAAPAPAQDRATFLSSIQNLARSTRPSSDPAFLAGMGQLYCQMQAVVTDAPLRPDMVLAVLHQKHPDTQPKSSTARDAQRKAMILAATLLCPERSLSASAQETN